jgi:hypothetical protein
MHYPRHAASNASSPLQLLTVIPRALIARL